VQAWSGMASGSEHRHRVVVSRAARTDKQTTQLGPNMTRPSSAVPSSPCAAWRAASGSTGGMLSRCWERDCRHERRERQAASRRAGTSLGDMPAHSVEPSLGLVS
jgi:hypothetical protein